MLRRPARVCKPRLGSTRIAGRKPQAETRARILQSQARASSMLAPAAAVVLLRSMIMGSRTRQRRWLRSLQRLDERRREPTRCLAPCVRSAPQARRRIAYPSISQETPRREAVRGLGFDRCAAHAQPRTALSSLRVQRSLTVSTCRGRRSATPTKPRASRGCTPDARSRRRHPRPRWCTGRYKNRRCQLHTSRRDDCISLVPSLPPEKRIPRSHGRSEGGP